MHRLGWRGRLVGGRAFRGLWGMVGRVFRGRGRCCDLVLFLGVGLKAYGLL